ncbi:MAG: rRNA maturation RNase YbeY [Parvularcula sp.]
MMTAPGGGAAALMIEVDVLVEDEGWDCVVPDELCQRCAAAVDSEIEDGSAGLAAILLTTDGVLAALNRDFRSKEGPTNVLSFPADESPPLPDSPQTAPPMLGDIAIALGVTGSEAAARGVSLSDHATHLVVHGLLHLLGYDHIDDDEALAMETLERRILARLGLSDPYA